MTLIALVEMTLLALVEMTFRSKLEDSLEPQNGFLEPQNNLLERLNDPRSLTNLCRYGSAVNGYLSPIAWVPERGARNPKYRAALL